MTVRDDYLARIGALIRDARQHSGLTQSELATELKTSQNAVSRIEKGQQNLTLDMLARIGAHSTPSWSRSARPAPATCASSAARRCRARST